MRDQILAALDKLDLAVAECVGVVPPTHITEVAELASGARARLSYPEEIVVVGLAGGTGSGKSSLLNAVLGEDIALTGGMRPTTFDPMAAVPATRADVMAGWLEAIGIEHHAVHQGPQWLCLVDFPDSDSVDIGHRVTADFLVRAVDVVVWVTDPEKYRDARLHETVAALAEYGGQFVFDLNQIDRLDPADVETVSQDLLKAVMDDGVSSPNIVPTAASPFAGPPIGVEGLLSALDRIGRDRLPSQGKILIDLTGAVARLDESIGPVSVEFDDVWQRALDAALPLIDSGELAGAAHLVAAHVEELSAQVGGETGRALYEISEVMSERLMKALADSDRPAQSSRARRQPPDEGDEGEPEPSFVAERDRFIRQHARSGAEIRGVLARRAKARASLTDLALAVADLERRLAKLASAADGD